MVSFFTRKTNAGGLTYHILYDTIRIRQGFLFEKEE